MHIQNLFNSKGSCKFIILLATHYFFCSNCFLKHFQNTYCKIFNEKLFAKAREQDEYDHMVTSAKPSPMPYQSDRQNRKEEIQLKKSTIEDTQYHPPKMLHFIDAENTW